MFVPVGAIVTTGLAIRFGRDPGESAWVGLLAGTAFSAVITDDGRLAVGAVKPDLLYRALG